MQKKYTHIFFDLDNTLWDFKTNSKLAMQITFDRFKIGEKQVDFDTYYIIYEKHNHTLWESYRKKEVDKKQLIKRRFADTFADLKITGIDPEEVNAFYLEEMAKQKVLYPGVIKLLEYLKSKHYQLYIITNGFKEVQNKKLKLSGLDTYFNKVFTSEEVKTPKPGREIFEYAVKSANAKKEKSLMVGDDWDVDILGALNFGIDAIFIGNCFNEKFLSETKSIEMRNEILRFDTINSAFSFFVN
jgi:putative hydrolase of the HAD superfamily